MLLKHFVCWRPNNVRMGYAYSKWAGSFVATRMSALGQKQTSAHVLVMSALPPKADTAERPRGVRLKFALALVHDERGDFNRIGKDHVGTVAHHASSD